MIYDANAYCMKFFANYLKITIIVISLFGGFIASGQSMLGKWQLVKESTCIEDDLAMDNDTTEASLLDDMKSMSGPSAQIVTFKEKGAGEESTRVLSKKKYANNKNFLYKFSGDMLIILDKKSQTITEMYKVEKIDEESLILSNDSRACETKVFVKIKDPKPN
jgi:hypothetical protein